MWLHSFGASRVENEPMPDKQLTADEIKANREAVAFLRDALKRNRLTQRTVALQMGVSEPTVSKWLAGTQNMTYAQLRTIAGIVGAKPTDLVGNSEDRERLARYETLARLAGDMTDEQLAALEGVARQLVAASRKQP